MANTHLAQVFTNLFGKEGEEIHYIIGLSTEVLTEMFVLCGHTYGTGIGVALTHHDTSQYDKRQCTERKFIGTQQGHDDNILCCLQLTIGLKAHLVSQTIQDECLLCLCKSDFRRNASKTHTAGRRSTRTALCTTDDNEVGLSLCHSGCNRSHATLCHKFYTDGSGGIDILEVEY